MIRDPLSSLRPSGVCEPRRNVYAKRKSSIASFATINRVNVERKGRPRVREVKGATDKDWEGAIRTRSCKAFAYGGKQLMGTVCIRHTCKREGYLAHTRHMAHYELM